jgi:hypothetical protein
LQVPFQWFGGFYDAKAWGSPAGTPSFYRPAAKTLQNRKPLTIPLMKRGNESGQDEQPFEIRGGDEGTRTPDLLHAKQALFQLSYIPTCFNYGGLMPDVKHI